MTSALLFVLMLTAPQAATRPAPTTEALGRAYFLFVQGLSLEGKDDAAAAIDYRQALDILPDSAPIHAQLAGVYARQGQTTDAMSEARAALAIDPSSREANRLLGWLLASSAARLGGTASGDTLDEAIAHLEKAGADGGDLSVQLLLSELYLRRRRAADAIPLLGKVLDDRPGYPPAMRMLVEAYRIAGDAANAEKVLDELDSGVPDTTAIRVAQIERYERADDWRSAAEAWDDLIANEPGARIYRPREALALANSGQQDEARALMLQIVQDWPRDVSSWYLKARIDAQAKDWKSADDAVAHIETLDPTDARGPLALAAVRSAQGNRRAAIQALEPRVKAPREADVTSGRYVQMVGELSQAYAAAGQRKRAVEVLEAAHKRLPDDQAVLFALGAAYEDNRQYPQAEQTFRQVIAANPNHATALNYLGYMLAERGEKLDDAVGLITRALAIDRNNPAYLDSLGWAYFKMGNFDAARDPLERAAAGLPKVSVIQDHLGDLYLQLKRYADAATAFDRALSGDRDGIDARAIEKKRDRARTLAGKS